MLPLLREELALLPGPVLHDGQPSHTLHDPVRNLFFQVDWPTFEVLRRWHLRDAALIAEAVRADTTLQLGPDDVAEVAAFFHDNQLLQPPPGAAPQWAGRQRARRGSPLRQLLHNYLFFRIPLLRPDAWLGRWAPRLDALYSTPFLVLTLLALGWGLVEVYRQWDRFAATLVDTASASGIAGYALTLAAVKLLHELGHAFTAKRQGCRVPTMGVAFLVLCPVAYTDTNEVWKLSARRQRLAVAAAGVLTELAVAAWSTWAWAVLPDGALRSSAFLLATTTWVATLAINASPFMRFDGYFLLSDWLGMPNLHARAFALARWQLREALFGLGAPPPEHLPRGRHAGLVVFALATWVYRLVVFLGIAALVYTFFVKAIGIVLFAVEIGWFVLLPLARELKAWHDEGLALWQRPRARRSAALGLLLAAVLFVPWPTRLTASGLLRPAAQYVVFAPHGAQLVGLPVADGQRVEAGTTLVRLASPDLASRLAGARARVERLRWQAAAAGFDAEQRAQWQSLQEQLATAQAELAALRAEAARYEPVAPFAGTLRDLAPDIRPGTWLGDGEALARLVGEQGDMVVTYLDEDDVGRVALGDMASFHADGPGGPVVRLQVVGIDADASRTLPEPELASLFGGSVAVREKNGQFHPERPVYRVSLKVLAPHEAAAQHSWRGMVVIAGRPAVPAWRYVRGGLALLRREAGF